jgi:hypothetical protein
MDEHAAMVSMLTGPTSSLVLLIGMLVAVWRVVTQSILPAGKAWVDKHLKQVDELLEQHAADREAWLASMRDCHDRSDAMTQQLDTIERKIGGLYGRHEALAGRLDAPTVDNGVAP